MALHLPLLRFGREYRSLDTATVVDHRSGEALATVSLANAGLVRAVGRKSFESRAILRAVPAARRLEMLGRAGALFLDGDVPLGGESMPAARYEQLLSATTGLPLVMARRNAVKIHHVLTQMPAVLRGLMRGLEPAVVDRGAGEQDGVPVSYVAQADALGVVLPNNSPGVNSLWLPALALGVPVMLKPGSGEPWTPLRIVNACIAAGFPPEAFAYLPTDHAGADAIVEVCGRSLVFGNDRTLAKHRGDARVEVHGTGHSKVIVGADAIGRRDWLDAVVRSIVENGGRSCVNASAVIVPRDGDAVAEELAARLAAIVPKDAADPDAGLSAFPDPKVAQALDAAIEAGLRVPGARDVTAAHRAGPRLVTHGGATYLSPTIVRCASLDHPLAQKELLLPYAAVVECPQEEVLERIGPSLVVTAVTEDPAFIEALLASRKIDRLNLGAVPTSTVRWDQPHEGNLFEFLFRRRALQRAEPAK
jgi:acyl-CoA reductase-like NAD-dependent aldehyde dehydrogenase